MRPEIKDALERAAADDDRSISSLVERVLQEWLTGCGYLAKAEAAKASARPTKPPKAAATPKPRAKPRARKGASA